MRGKWRMATETVLLVDDEKEILQLLSLYFGNEGYRLLAANDGAQAGRRSMRTKNPVSGLSGNGIFDQAFDCERHR